MMAQQETILRTYEETKKELEKKDLASKMALAEAEKQKKKEDTRLEEEMRFVEAARRALEEDKLRIEAEKQV